MATEKDYFDWDDAIENDGSEFIILPEGDYVFTVVDVERGWFDGSAKMSACNKAILTLEVRTPDGIARITTNLMLHKSMEWKLSSFFRSIGQKQHGEKLVMNWAKVPGSRGIAHFKPRKYTGNDGEERTTNDCARFLDYDAEKCQAPMIETGNDEDIPF